jgi:superfamily II DNA or RNA helicase
VPLRNYQIAALDKCRERYLAGVNRQLLVMATGLGKAVIFSALRNHLSFQKRVMVLVHREELAAQAEDKIHHWNPGLMVGVEMAQRRSRQLDTHIVASVPTLGRKNSERLKQFDPLTFDCIVSDEVHHSVSPQWTRVLHYFGLTEPNSRILSLGLTATPNRSDGVGLRRLFDEIVYDMGLDAGIREGYLVDLRCWRISSKTTLDAVRTTAGDFNEGDLAKTVNTPERNGMVVKAWLQNAKDKKTLIFTANIQHALDLAEAFKAFGVSAAAVWGDDPERHEKLRKHRQLGEITVLCNCAVLTEGYDDKGIECIVLARPTKSSLLLTQMLGRGTRIPEGYGHISEVPEGGKTSCTVLDVVDTTSKHQLCTVPSLLGLPAQIDLRGKTYREAKDRIERVAAEFPAANLSDLRDLDRLDYLATQFSLFHVKYPPEVEKLTELAWRKQGDGYVLPVKRERLMLCRDLLDEWWVRGSINGKPVEIHAQNLAGAFNAADCEVLNNGGDQRQLVVRNARWHDQQPTGKQINLCRKIRLPIPAGATRGMVSSALDAHFGRVREKNIDNEA